MWSLLQLRFCVYFRRGFAVVLPGLPEQPPGRLCERSNCVCTLVAAEEAQRFKPSRPFQHGAARSSEALPLFRMQECDYGEETPNLLFVLLASSNKALAPVLPFRACCWLKANAIALCLIFRTVVALKLAFAASRPTASDARFRDAARHAPLHRRQRCLRVWRRGNCARASRAWAAAIRHSEPRSVASSRDVSLLGFIKMRRVFPRFSAGLCKVGV